MGKVKEFEEQIVQREQNVRLLNEVIDMYVPDGNPEVWLNKIQKLRDDNVQGKFCPEPIYFHVISQGWNSGLQRQEVEINCGENGKVVMVKTEEGFYITVHGQTQHINTQVFYEDDLIEPEE
jgi:hypothetical protein